MSTKKDWKATCFDPLCEIHNAGEWTVERLSNYRDPIALANDINAALAAEREAFERLDIILNTERKKFANQLADEREKVAWCPVHAPTTEEPITCCPCCEAVHEREKVLE